VARSHPEGVDSAAFRLAFTRTSAYAPYYTDALEEDKALEEAFRVSDWPEVLARANAALERCYVRVKPHMYAAAAPQSPGGRAGSFTSPRAASPSKPSAISRFSTTEKPKGYSHRSHSPRRVRSTCAFAPFT